MKYVEFYILQKRNIQNQVGLKTDKAISFLHNTGLYQMIKEVLNKN
jgi:hypothetical protein